MSCARRGAAGSTSNAAEPPAAASIAKDGGRYLVRGAKRDVLEGHWRPTRLVVLEFSNVDAAKRWYPFDEYNKAKPIRLQHSAGHLVLVEGVSTIVPPPANGSRSRQRRLVRHTR